MVGGFLACCHGRWGGWWVLGGGVSMVIEEEKKKCILTTAPIEKEKYAVICPTGVGMWGIPLYPWQHLDRTVWAAR